MLESSPAYIKCYQCKRGPKEFSFLLCNHIICGKCISKNIQLTDKYNIVKCSCGKLTYFNQNYEIIDNFIVKENNCTQNNKRKINTQLQKSRKSFESKASQDRLNKQKNDAVINSSNTQISEIFSLQSQQSFQNNNAGQKNSSLEYFSIKPHNNTQSQDYCNLKNEQKKRQNKQQGKYQKVKKNYGLNECKKSSQTPFHIKETLKLSESSSKLIQNEKTTLCGEQTLLLSNYLSIIKNNQHMKKSELDQRQALRQNDDQIQNKKNTNNNQLINQLSTHFIINNKNNCNKILDYRDSDYFGQQKQRNLLRQNDSNPILIPNVKTIAESVTLPQTIDSLQSQKHSINSQNSQTSLENKKRQNSIITNKPSQKIDSVINNKYNKIVIQNQEFHRLKTQENKIKDSFHSRFQSQIQFLGMRFKKDLEQIQYYFTNVIGEIKSKFQSYEDSLRSLYSQKVLSNGYHRDAVFFSQLSQLVQQGYEKQIQTTFRLLKDNLGALLIYCKNKQFQSLFDNLLNHNQKLLNSPKSTPHLHSHNLTKKTLLRNQNKIKHIDLYPTQQTLNQSQMIDDDGSDLQNVKSFEYHTKKNYVKKFQTVHQNNQKFERSTTKNNRSKFKSPQNHLDSFNSTSIKTLNFNNNKRVHTQNFHTHLKSPVSLHFYQKENYDQSNYQKPQQKKQIINYRFTEKPQRKSNALSVDKKSQKKKKEIIYFSPTLPYCKKHLLQKRKQARNYVSYIEKLCHEKKMRSQQQLFKKVKQNNHNFYEFKNENEIHS